MRSFLKLKPVIYLFLFIFLTGCVATSHKVRPDLTLHSDTKKILLMPMDVELSTLTAGGLLEPNAEWTGLAEGFVHDSVEEVFSTSGISLVSHEVSSEQSLSLNDSENLDMQLIKLHEAVGSSILMHKYIPILKLPSKEGKFDWSLGKDTKVLNEKYGADYALFLHLRDSYCSAGRVAVIFVAAAFGVGVPGGQQTGFASLVDLNTGEIVWFNRLMRGVGDLRNEKAADESVKVLLSDFPMS